jgi:hypothetical protein
MGGIQPKEYGGKVKLISTTKALALVVLAFAVSQIVAPITAEAVTEAKCREIKEAEIAGGWRPPNRPRSRDDGSSFQFDLPEILIRYHFPSNEDENEASYTVLVTYRLSMDLTTKADLLSAREHLGQLVAEVTGLLRAHSVEEHCSLATGEALGWRVQDLVRAILHPLPVRRALAGQSMRWVKL